MDASTQTIFMKKKEIVIVKTKVTVRKRKLIKHLTNKIETQVGINTKEDSDSTQGINKENTKGKSLLDTIVREDSNTGVEPRVLGLHSTPNLVHTELEPVRRKQRTKMSSVKATIEQICYWENKYNEQCELINEIITQYILLKLNENIPIAKLKEMTKLKNVFLTNYMQLQNNKYEKIDPRTAPNVQQSGTHLPAFFYFLYFSSLCIFYYGFVSPLYGVVVATLEADISDERHVVAYQAASYTANRTAGEQYRV
ncbi:hypothetical protein AGLY_016427 [Aphis glycines]|uniref:Uncharacterized protein n=1 Tax=Aphis glycines TaxID=307491 RepID=A0A6G0SZ12_APHGL|nr:hypothetical protein AGLY_016427 [Aphis glycines]